MWKKDLIKPSVTSNSSPTRENLLVDGLGITHRTELCRLPVSGTLSHQNNQNGHPIKTLGKTQWATPGCGDSQERSDDNCVGGTRIVNSKTRGQTETDRQVSLDKFRIEEGGMGGSGVVVLEVTQRVHLITTGLNRKWLRLFERSHKGPSRDNHGRGLGKRQRD